MVVKLVLILAKIIDFYIKLLSLSVNWR